MKFHIGHQLLNMRKLKLLLAVIVACATHLQAQTIDLEKDLQQLDDAVANHQSYDRQKLQNIAAWKKEADTFVTPEEQYNFLKHLYDEYMKFDPDSAAYYAQRCIEVTEKAGLHDLCLMSRIDAVHLVISQGEVMTAQRMLEKLPPIEEMPANAQMKMAITMMEYQMRVYLKGFAEKQHPKEDDMKNTWEKYSPYLPDNLWQKHYYRTHLTNDHTAPLLVADLKHARQPSIKAAMLYVAMSSQCQAQGKIDECLHYLILSAINDIKCSNREASALVYLMNNDKLPLDVDRAFKYIMLCTENARTFKDVGRSYEITKAHARVTKAYQAQLQHYCRECQVVIGLLAVAVVLIVVLLTIVVKRRRRQASLLRKVEEMNKSLEQSVESELQAQQKLKETNARLRDEIAYHNNNFINVYHLITKYIAGVKTFKKSIYNLITTGKVDQARKELNRNNDTDQYLQGFFAHFDKAFLLSHPDFVSRFNALLRDDCQIVPAEPDTLTPELRIYALVSMGITDSVSIAEFLHYSTQTIYNYRLKVRHGARIPEKTFADTVAKLYSEG